MGMLFRPAWRAILGVRNPQCHVYRLSPIFTGRNLHSESESCSLSQTEAVWDGHERSVHGELPESSGPSKVAADFGPMWQHNYPLVYPRQVTLHAQNPKETSQQQILTALRKFCATRTVWQECARGRDQAVVILATPSFARWLEDVSFITSFLHTITQSKAYDEKARLSAEWSKTSQKDSGEPSERFEVNVICACVDGLPPGVDSMPYMVGRGADEGFSILQRRKGQVPVRHRDAFNEADFTTGERLEKPSTLTLTNANPHDLSRVVLPLANTLFSNGRRSTLLITQWRLENGQFVKAKSSERRNQVINVFESPGLGQHCIRVPAAPLTPARRIVSGLGNIVKQIDLGEADPGPASRELEASINEYLFETQREKSTIAVWALIVPKSSIAQHQPPPQYELLSDQYSVRLQWRMEPSNPEFIGHWLSQGARFCRVLSGGGGWGAKQGLLSLDPESTLNDISKARVGYSNESLEDQQKSVLGSIAEPDSLIQFFVVDKRLPRAPPPTPSSSLEELQRSELWPPNTVFGTVASTVDDQKTAQTDYGIGNEVICHPGLFGAVSESGLFLEVSPSPSGEYKSLRDAAGIIGTPATPTKLDLPNSYVYKDTRKKVAKLLKRGFSRIWRQTNGPKNRHARELQLQGFMRKYARDIYGLSDSTDEYYGLDKMANRIDSSLQILSDFSDESTNWIFEKSKKKRKSSPLIRYHIAQPPRPESSAPSDQPGPVEPVVTVGPVGLVEPSSQIRQRRRIVGVLRRLPSKPSFDLIRYHVSNPNDPDELELVEPSDQTDPKRKRTVRIPGGQPGEEPSSSLVRYHIAKKSNNPPGPKPSKPSEQPDLVEPSPQIKSGIIGISSKLRRKPISSVIRYHVSIQTFPNNPIPDDPFPDDPFPDDRFPDNPFGPESSEPWDQPDPVEPSYQITRPRILGTQPQKSIYFFRSVGNFRRDHLRLQSQAGEDSASEADYEWISSSTD